MATHEQKTQAERRVRSLLEQNDLPQPDHVEYGGTCIWLIWRDRKAAVQVQIDEPPPGYFDAPAGGQPFGALDDDEEVVA